MERIPYKKRLLKTPPTYSILAYTSIKPNIFILDLGFDYYVFDSLVSLNNFVNLNFSQND